MRSIEWYFTCQFAQFPRLSVHLHSSWSKYCSAGRWADSLPTHDALHQWPSASYQSTRPRIPKFWSNSYTEKTWLAMKEWRAGEKPIGFVLNWWRCEYTSRQVLVIYSCKNWTIDTKLINIIRQWNAQSRKVCCSKTATSFYQAAKSHIWTCLWWVKW